MTIDPFTFAFEIVNFLVLLWLLHHFLYRPIQRAIAERRQALNEEIMTAQQREQEALALKNTYEQRIADWEREKTRQQDELQQTLSRERQTALAGIRQVAEAERVRLQTLHEQELATRRRQAVSSAVQTALRLTGKMLERLAGSELDQAILRVLLEDLEQLPETDRSLLRSAFAGKREPVTVVTARSLDQDQQQRLQTAIAGVLETETRWTFRQDPNLLSGYQLVVGDQVVHANLSDELAFFGRSLSLEDR